MPYLEGLTPACGYHGPSVNCGCDYHREWVRQNPEHPDVVAGRADVVAWIAEHPGHNPATGRAMAHPDDFLTEVYGSGATDAELHMMGLVH